VLDEAQGCPQNVWDEILMGTMAQNEAWLIVIGTPRGTGNLFHKFCLQGDDPSDDTITTITRTVADTGEIWLASCRTSNAATPRPGEYLLVGASCRGRGRVDHRINMDIRVAISARLPWLRWSGCWWTAWTCWRRPTRRLPC
jgi:hypothetical protein